MNGLMLGKMYQFDENIILKICSQVVQYKMGIHCDWINIYM